MSKLISIFFLYNVCVKAQICFQPTTNFNASTNPISLTNADFNGDGKKDLAVANKNANNLSILLGNGIGGFATPINFSLSNQPSSIISTDFNNDGVADIAVTISGGAGGPLTGTKVAILLGVGTGNFGSAVYFTVGAGPTSLVSADFNLDGKKDLAVSNANSSNVSVLLGTGTGSFGTTVNYASGNNPFSIISADFNSDGKADLATANYGSNSVSVLLGLISGSFSPASNISAGSMPYSITSADFNGDGKKDLALANWGSSGVSVISGNGIGGFGSPANFSSSGGSTSITSADFNGDNKTDLATNATTFLGTGTGSFVVSPNFITGAGPISVTSADFNNDGKIDLGVANQNSDNVSILLNCTTVSVSDILDKKDIAIYPNPTTGNFVIESERESPIVIVNILGETIITHTLQHDKNEINLTNHASGIYFIKTKDSTFKIIKQ